jgi:hypothetical protein
MANQENQELRQDIKKAVEARLKDWGYIGEDIDIIVMRPAELSDLVGAVLYSVLA